MARLFGQLLRPTVRRRSGAAAISLGLVASLLTSSIALAGDVSGVNVQLPLGATVAGVVRTTANRPVANAWVQVVASDGSPYASAQTDARGTYAVTGLPAGVYEVAVVAPAGNLQSGYYTPANSNHFTSTRSRAAHLTFGPNRTGINVRLPAGYAISGYVRTTTGRPIRDALVQAVGPAGAPSEIDASTDVHGKFVLRGLAPARYRLIVRGPSGGRYESGWFATTTSTHFTTRPGAASWITVGPTRTGIVIKLPVGYTISGTLLGPGGLPLSSGFVEAFSSAGDSYGLTDQYGRYSLAGLNPGTYVLSFSDVFGTRLLDGYYSAGAVGHFTAAAASASGVRVGPNRTVPAVTLPTGFTVSGRILDGRGAPVNGARVSIDELYVSAWTGADGTFTVAPLPAGSYAIRVDAPQPGPWQSGYYASGIAGNFTPSAASATKVTVGSDVAGLEMGLPAGYAISGNVTLAGGGLGAAAFVTAVDAADPAFQSSALVMLDGTYTVTGLHPGTYTLAIAPDYDSPFVGGYYSVTAPTHLVAAAADASPVTVGP